ncbi:hypothetical protein [Pareuzebyella sediminis]|uniref:hypothetical protein n=1 Tax=Pareuzebyella sediminis TaxID=2607998 RepID=UPI0011ED2AB8|nr:hypothetical protein [Pareuzebyella sediminis]
MRSNKKATPADRINEPRLDMPALLSVRHKSQQWWTDNGTKYELVCYKAPKKEKKDPTIL